MDEKVSAHILIEGKVQGVGFRNFVQRYAFLLSLKGSVKNLPNGHVEVEVEGDRSKTELLIEHLHRGSALSKVTKVSVSWGAFVGRYSDFSILF